MLKLKLFTGFLIVGLFICTGCNDNTTSTTDDKQIPPPSSPSKQTTPAKDTITSQPQRKESTPTMQTSNPRVLLKTSLGEITLELYPDKAPATVENFLQYVNEGFYDNTIFHRVIAGFMNQGGGFSTDSVQKETHSPIKNEASNGLKNDRGTISMARTNDPDSATSQFFLNFADNKPLDYVSPSRPGYAVFGKVIEGLNVLDTINKVKTTQSPFTTHGQKVMFSDVPAEQVVILSASVLAEPQN